MEGDRFAFGSNWARFLRLVDERRIDEAERSLRGMLDVGLAGRTFLDVGSGSGLFSLAAARLGAARVHSLDYDVESVACTRELRRRFLPDHSAWTVEQASVLEADHLRSLGTWDIVYAWGVLHHTGQMHQALHNVAGCVAPSGWLFISIYNDQGGRSDIWRRIKRRHNALPAWLRPAFVALVMAPYELRSAVIALASGHPARYVESWTNYKAARGMSRWRDHVDWVGGYPFEVARPGEIFDFYRVRGFTLRRLRTDPGWGTNEYVFERD